MDLLKHDITAPLLSFGRVRLRNYFNEGSQVRWLVTAVILHWYLAQWHFWGGGVSRLLEPWLVGWTLSTWSRSGAPEPLPPVVCP